MKTKKEKVPHTPTPWKGVLNNQEANRSMILSEDGKKWIISLLHNGEQMPAKQKADLEFIVNAVNNHEKLIGVLETIEARIEGVWNHSGLNDSSIRISDNMAADILCFIQDTLDEIK